MVISRLSSLEALLSQELRRYPISVQWNTFVVAPKAYLDLDLLTHYLLYLVCLCEPGPWLFIVMLVIDLLIDR